MDRSTDGTCGKQTGYARVEPSYVKYSQFRPAPPVVLSVYFIRGLHGGIRVVNLYLQETTYVRGRFQSVLIERSFDGVTPSTCM